MTGDIFKVVVWWLVWWVVGWAAWPITRRVFKTWEDGGYIFTKILGGGIVTWLVWAVGTLHILAFTQLMVLAVVVGLMAVTWIGIGHQKQKVNKKLILAEEIMFMVTLLIWVYVKGHEPTINGLEKFMDFGFTSSILDGAYFPPKDMWFAGGNINYYYFGHLLMAVFTRLSGLDLGNTFNLMLCTLFALTFTMTWSIMRKLLSGLHNKWKIAGATLTAVLMVLAGNLQTVYAFTKGYSSDNPPPFWTIWSNFFNKSQFMAGWNSYWYPNATRFIPYTIHEFPAYSFVVSDVHGHVLDIPIALLCIALLITMFTDKEKEDKKDYWQLPLVYGIATGWAFATNALDGLIYLGLWVWLLIVLKKPLTKGVLIKAGVIATSFAIMVLPFVTHFKSFVSGLGVDCPPIQLTGTKIGPFIFETTDKCQKSPLWMWLLLWGFFWYCGLVLAVYTDDQNKKTKTLLLAFTVFSLGLTIFPEFFYFKDIYPMHFRSNTMFKLGYQAYMLMMLVSGYSITKLLVNRFNWQKVAYVAGLVPLLGLVSIYPLFSLKSYFGKLTPENYKGIYGLNWIWEKYPDDAKAMHFLTTTIKWPQQPVVLEANGDSYTDDDRFSAMTGYPTMAGWLVHEWLWRSYEQIAARDEEVKQVYEMTSPETALSILDKYQVKYIIVGETERQKYPNLSEEKIAMVADQVFSSGGTKVYQVHAPQNRK